MSANEFDNIIFQTLKGRRRGKFVVLPNGGGIDFRTLATATGGPSKTIQIKGEDISEGLWQQNWDLYTLKVSVKSGPWIRFNGFKHDAYPVLSSLFQQLQQDLPKQYLATKGGNMGEFDASEQVLSFLIDSKLNFELPWTQIVQTVVQSKNELAFEFAQAADTAAQGEQLYEMRVWCPDMPIDEDENDNNNNDDDSDKPVPPTAAFRFQQDLLAKGKMIESSNSSKPIATFELMLAVPRGRYTVELYEQHIKLHNKTFNYKVQHKGITKMFLLDNKSQQQHFFIIALNPPIRQGRTSYPYLVIQFNSSDEITTVINLTPERIAADYSVLLKPEMVGQAWDVCTRVFKAITAAKVVIPGAFVSRHGGAAVRCSLKAQDGYCFMLEKSLFYVKKPPTFIRHNAIESIEFDRVSNSSSSGSSNKTIDMKVSVRDGDRSVEYVFTSINRDEFELIEQYVKHKNISYSVREDHSSSSISRAGVNDRDDDNANDKAYRGQLEAERESDDDESDDSDFGSDDGKKGSDSDVDGTTAAKKKRSSSKKGSGSESGSASGSGGSGSDGSGSGGDNQGSSSDSQAGSSDDEDMAPEVDESGDDGEKIRGKSSQQKATKKAQQKANKDTDMEGDKKERKEKAPKKDKSSSSNNNSNDSNSDKKDTLASRAKAYGIKGAMNAYMLFVQSQRPIYLEANKELKPTEVTTLAAAAWKVLPEADKQPYNERATADKIRYQAAVSEMQANAPDDGSSNSTTKKRKNNNDGSGKDKKKTPTAYMLYNAVERKRITDNDSTKALTFGEIAKKVGENWKACTAEQQQPYHTQAKVLLEAAAAAGGSNNGDDGSKRKVAAKKKKASEPKRGNSGSDSAPGEDDGEPVVVAAAPRAMKLKIKPINADDDNSSTQNSSQKASSKAEPMEE